jgi:hypothetical protein
MRSLHIERRTCAFALTCAQFIFGEWGKPLENSESFSRFWQGNDKRNLHGGVKICAIFGQLPVASCWLLAEGRGKRGRECPHAGHLSLLARRSPDGRPLMTPVPFFPPPPSEFVPVGAHFSISRQDGGQSDLPSGRFCLLTAHSRTNESAEKEWRYLRSYHPVDRYDAIFLYGRIEERGLIEVNNTLIAVFQTADFRLWRRPYPAKADFLKRSYGFGLLLPAEEGVLLLRPAQMPRHIQGTQNSQQSAAHGSDIQCDPHSPRLPGQYNTMLATSRVEVKLSTGNRKGGLLPSRGGNASQERIKGLRFTSIISEPYCLSFLTLRKRWDVPLLRPPCPKVTFPKTSEWLPRRSSFPLR